MGTKNQFWLILLSVCLAITPWSFDGCKNAEKVQAQSSQVQQVQQAPAATYATPTADELYQLVAPIALFPDNLVVQVLAASTYPNQVEDAHTWLQQNSIQGYRVVYTDMKGLVTSYMAHCLTNDYLDLA